MIKDLKSEIKLLLTVALTRVPSSNLSWTKKQFSVQLKVWTPLTFLLLIMYSFNEDVEFMEGFKINFTGCVEWKQQSTIKEGWHPKSLKILIFLCWKRDFCNNFLIPPIAKPYFIKKWTVFSTKFEFKIGSCQRPFIWYKLSWCKCGARWIKKQCQPYITMYDIWQTLILSTVL